MIRELEELRQSMRPDPIEVRQYQGGAPTPARLEMAVYLERIANSFEDRVLSAHAAGLVVAPLATEFVKQLRLQAGWHRGER